MSVCILRNHFAKRHLYFVDTQNTNTIPSSQVWFKWNILLLLWEECNTLADATTTTCYAMTTILYNRDDEGDDEMILLPLPFGLTPVDSFSINSFLHFNSSYLNQLFRVADSRSFLLEEVNKQWYVIGNETFVYLKRKMFSETSNDLQWLFIRWLWSQLWPLQFTNPVTINMHIHNAISWFYNSIHLFRWIFFHLLGSNPVHMHFIKWMHLQKN